MLGWFRRKTIEDIVNQKKKIRVDGVPFVIRKINPLDYMSGSKAVRQIFQTYAATSQESVELKEAHAQEIQKHYEEVFLTAVVSPKLKAKKTDQGEGIPVQHLLTDWGFAAELYSQIIAFSYEKKKSKHLNSYLLGA